MTLYKVHRTNKMTLTISNKIYVAAAVTALAALGVYAYMARNKKVVPDSDVESDDEEKKD